MDVASELDPHFANRPLLMHCMTCITLYHCIMCPVLLASTTQIFACYGTVCALKILKSIRSNKTFQGGVRKSKMIPSASSRNLAFHNEVGVTPAARSERSDVYCDSTCRCSCMVHRRKQGGQTASISAICCAALLLNISLAAECPPAAVSFRRLFNAFFIVFPFMSFHVFLWPYNAKQMYCKQSQEFHIISEYFWHKPVELQSCWGRGQTYMIHHDSSITKLQLSPITCNHQSTWLWDYESWAACCSASQASDIWWASNHTLITLQWDQLNPSGLWSMGPTWIIRGTTFTNRISQTSMFTLQIICL